MSLEKLNEKIRVPLTIFIYIVIILLVAGKIFGSSERAFYFVLSAMILLLLIPMFRLIYASLLLLKVGEHRSALYGLITLMLSVTAALLGLLL